MILIAGVLPLQMIPAKLDQLLAMNGHHAGQVPHQQRGQLQQLHVDWV